MVFRTAIVGHSQIPTSIPWTDDIEYHVFRKSGGVIRDLQEAPLNRVYETRFDLIVVFLGGNDIIAHVQYPSSLASRLRDILLDFSRRAGAVAFVAIEDRTYPPQSRFNITTEEYKAVQRRVNNNLRRFCRSKLIHVININRHIFAHNVRRDGVHFNTLATNELIRKIQRAAIQAKEKAESN